MNTNQQIRELSERLILHVEEHFNNFRSDEIIAELKRLAHNHDNQCIDCIKKSSNEEVLNVLKEFEQHLKRYDYIFDVLNINPRVDNEYHKRMMMRPKKMFLVRTKNILKQLTMMIQPVK